MNDTLISSVACVAIAAILCATLILSAETNPPAIHDLGDGVKCATLSSSNGVAINCWKVYGQ